MNQAERAFTAERRRQLRELTRITRRSMADVEAAVQFARQRVINILASAPTEWQLYHLGQLRIQLDAAIERLQQRIGRVWSESLDEAWAAGISLVDAPLVAAGAIVTDTLVGISDRRLLAMQSFMTDKITEISQVVKNRIRQQLSLVVTGAQSAADTVSVIDAVLGGGNRSRALTITRTEVGRAYATSTQLRLSQSATVVPGLKKQWRRSGKIASRETHDFADGQIREVDEPFDIDGEQLMYPRDPTGSAGNTISCGCTMLPYKDDWEVTHPDKVPFTTEEQKLKALRRILPGR